MEDFWLKSAFLATFPSNSIGLKLTKKIRVLEILMQIIKCPILVVTMKLLIAPRIHILVVLWTFTFPPSFLITLYINPIYSIKLQVEPKWYPLRGKKFKILYLKRFNIFKK